LEKVDDSAEESRFRLQQKITLPDIYKAALREISSSRKRF
jgi:hypothetical protein